MKIPYKLVNRALTLFFGITVLNSSAQNFTWMHGSNFQANGGTYGTIGAPAAANTPGARFGAVQWKDANGNFWLFGGIGYDNTSSQDLLNDLWKYNPTTNQWTWMSGSNTGGQNTVYGTQGTPAASNMPGGRFFSTSWSDNSGNLWLFAGVGYDGSFNVDYLTDLWRYNIATNTWTWMKGPNVLAQTGIYGTMGTPAAANYPGSRLGASAWTDNTGNLWMFGGDGYDAVNNTIDDNLNDLWRYNPTTNQWTWMKGSNIYGQGGIYGTINVPAASNVPGGRYNSGAVTDASGNFWLFGGYAYDGSSTMGEMNDLWKYNVSTGNWSWESGLNIADQAGVFGPLGVPTNSAYPASRDGANMWRDSNGDLYVFAGFVADPVNSSADYGNDLWKFTPGTNQWTWVKGATTLAQSGTYGTIGVTNMLSIPPSRGYSCNWVDNSNNLWLFGGDGFTSQNSDQYNDLWKISICAANTLSVNSTANSICSGSNATLTASGASTYTWMTTVPQPTASIVVNPTVTTTYTVISISPAACLYTATKTQSVFAITSLTVASNKLASCPGEPVVLTASGGNTYTWNVTGSGNTNTILVTPTITTAYNVSSTDANSCAASGSISQVVSACTGISKTGDVAFELNFYPNPSNGNFVVNRKGFESAQILLIFNTLGEVVYETTLSLDTTNVQANLSKGIYTYKVSGTDSPEFAGKLIVQ